MGVEQIMQAVAVTAELTGANLSPAAQAMMVKDLTSYPEDAVFRALTRCRKELTGRLTLAAIIERIAEQDGWLSANEAWATALRYFDEAETVVLNEETKEACASVRPIMTAGDEVGARMAFRDAYDRAVSSARESGKRPQWFPSLGDDKEIRARVLIDAVERGLLAHSQVSGLLPAPTGSSGAAIAGLLSSPQGAAAEDVKAKISDLRAKFGLHKP